VPALPVSVQAKSLGIDLNPHPTQSTEDPPMYEPVAPGAQGPPAPMQVIKGPMHPCT